MHPLKHQLNSKLLVRVAGLPFSALDVLHAQRGLYEIAKGFLQAQETVNRLKSEFDHELYQFIKKNGQRPDLQEWIRIKRDVFNDRFPKRPDLFDQLIDLGSPRLKELAVRWKHAMLQKSTLKEQGSREAVQGEWVFHQHLLQSILEQEGFMKTLPLASPTTNEAVLRAVSAKKANMTTRARKLQLGLIKYWTRTICKTSPFGYLGMVGIGHLGSEDRTLDEWLPARSYSRINQTILQTVSENMDGRYTVNPNLWTQGTDVSVIRRDQGRLPQILYRSGETRLTITLDEDLQFLLEKEVRERIWSADDLQKLIVSRMQDMTEEDCAELFTGLLELQVLIPYDVWRLDYQAAGSQNNTLLSLEKLGKNFGEESAEVRAQTIRRIEELVRTAAEGQPETVKLVPLYDDCFLQEEMVFEQGRFEGLLADMDALHGALPIWDHKLRERLILGELFRRSFGERGECQLPQLLECVLSYKEEHAAEFRTWDFNPFQDSDIALLEKLRVQAIEHLASQQAGESLHLQPEFLRDLARQLPAHLVEMPYSFMFFVQPTEAGEGVLNNMLSGFGRCFSRYASIGESLRDLPETLQVMQDLSPKTGEWVDLYATFGFNANLRPPLTERFVDYTGFSKQPEGIRLDQLVFYYDPLRKMIRVKTCAGQEVFPLHLGQMSLMYAPSVFKVLASLMHTDALTLNVANVIRYALPEQMSSTSDGVLTVPEVKMDKLILSRRRWYVPSEMLAGKEAMSEWEYYLHVLECFQRQGLPVQFFMRPSPASVPQVRSKLDDYFKPQYIDLTSFALFKLFKKNVQQMTGEIILESVQPDFSELLRLQGEYRQVEVGFEWYRRVES